MALAILILHDLPDGNVTVSAHCEPALEPGQQPTKAQGALIMALNALDQMSAPAGDSAAGTDIERHHV